MENEPLNESPLSPLNPKKRGRIKKLSFGSTKRAKFVLRNVIPQLTHMAVLTYPKEFPLDGIIVKDHLHKIKLRLDYRNIKLFWFMEFQRRGAVHFNLVMTKEIEDSELKKIWYEIVGSKDTKHLRHGAYIEAIKAPQGMLHYLTNYLTKQEQKRVPQGFQNLGRYWGYSLSLLPHTINIVIGTPKQIQELRASFRPIRKWVKGKIRHWRKKKYVRNKYVVFRPGDYLTVRDGYKFVEELRKRKMKTFLFERAEGGVSDGLCRGDDTASTP